MHFECWVLKDHKTSSKCILGKYENEKIIIIKTIIPVEFQKILASANKSNMQENKDHITFILLA